MRADGRIRSGDLALLVGFGAGLCYASQAVVLP
jgi:3-oxoacyl-[acyl-carrier-protein] synthase-3